MQGWEAWPVCSRRYGLQGRMHTVKAGDTLSGLARKYGVQGGWRALYQANKDIVGCCPDRLNVGTLLVIPKSAKGAKGTKGSRRAAVVFGAPLDPVSARPPLR